MSQVVRELFISYDFMCIFRLSYFIMHSVLPVLLISVGIPSASIQIIAYYNCSVRVVVLDLRRNEV